MKPRLTIKYSFTEQIKLATVLVVFCVTLIYTDWLWDWDQNIYDAQMRTSSRPAPDDIVIVSVDEASLNKFGRWPWPRNVHATLIDRLSSLGAKTIILDFIFSEKDRSNQKFDDDLARAIRSAGNIVLPVLVERTSLTGQLKETLPLPKLIEAGALLGHVHVELDADGVARGTYLYEGLGEPHWPHISLIALESQSGNVLHHLESSENGSPYVWYRANPFKIPFSGPPGHFKRISYADIIQNDVDNISLAGKTVFVGVTATGLGDALPTPVSGHSQPMPGIEINANIFAALRDHINIQPMPQLWRVLLSIFIILIPVFIYPRISPRRALILNIGLIISSFILSLSFLYYWQIWFAPLALIVTLTLSYPLWSWRRLEFTARYLSRQIELLADESDFLPNRYSHLDLSTLKFVSNMLFCKGWAVYGDDNTKLSGSDKFTQLPPKTILNNVWSKFENYYWLKLNNNLEATFLGLMLPDDRFFSPHQNDFLENYKNYINTEETDNKKDTIEIIEHQILKVQKTTAGLRDMRRFVSASLDQMADAVIIISSLGEIMLYNQRAELLFGKNNLEQTQIFELLSKNNLGEKTLWYSKISTVLMQHKTLHFQASQQSNKDLLIQITPLVVSDKKISGLIISFSDISDIKNAEKKRHEYINFLSHDLRSPLSSALAIIDLSMETNHTINSNNFQRLKNYIERSLELTENFVQIARADNIDRINFIALDFLVVLLNAIDQLWELATEKNIVIDFQSGLEQAECFGDAKLLERALINILGNAVKYSPQHTNITVTLKLIDNNYHCIIKDRGYGISENDIPYLFTRFHRGLNRDDDLIPGTGLGLAFVKTVIDGHNGKISVDSEPDHGSTFVLILPADPTQYTKS